MYRVLVVDDEEPARETLRYLINWETTPFRIADTAKDGVEALEKYSYLRPHLIFVDIQMPIMDGLELIRKIRCENEDQKFVIMSCHENFNYAKEAIKLGVSDYLLKDMLNSRELYNLLDKIKGELEDDEKFEYSNLNNKLVSNDTNMLEEQKNLALQEILYENFTDDELYSYIRKYNLDFSSKYYVIFGIVIDDFKRYSEMNGTNQKKHNKYEIIRLIKVILNEFRGGECFYDEKGSFIVVAGLAETNSELYCISLCHAITDKIHASLIRFASITVSIGVSRSFNNINDIKVRYQEAIELVKYRVFLGKGKTIMYNIKFLKANTLNPDLLSKIINELKSELEKGNADKVKELLKSIYSEEIESLIQHDYLKYVNSNVLGIFVDFCNKNNISYSKVFESDYIPIEKLEEFETIKEMSEWFCNIVSRLHSLSTTNSKISFSMHVMDAIKYIKSNYWKKLGLSQIAWELGVNKAYLCRIYTKETGENLTDYINKVRIEKAKEMMLSSNFKIYEIAEKVGFKNIQHFNNNFKKLTGQSPAKFRNTELMEVSKSN